MQTIQRKTTSRMLGCRQNEDSPGHTHLGDVVKESDYPLPGRCWGNNRRGAVTWIWSKVDPKRTRYPTWGAYPAVAPMGGAAADEVRLGM